MRAQDLTRASTRLAFGGATVLGAVEISWNPTLVVTVPASSVAGVYSGTVTHSVA